MESPPKLAVQRLIELWRGFREIPVLGAKVREGELGPFPLIEESAIQEAEAQLGFSLPESYRIVFEASQVGLPAQLQFFLLGDVPNSLHMLRRTERARDPFGPASSYLGCSLPKHLIAFASNFAMGIFAFDISAGLNDGEYPIVYWEDEIDPEKDPAEVQKVAASFSEFLEAELTCQEKYLADFHRIAKELPQLSYDLEEDSNTIALLLPKTRPPFTRVEQASELVLLAYVAEGIFKPVQRYCQEVTFWRLDVPKALSDALVSAKDVSALNRLWKKVILSQKVSYRRMNKMLAKAKSATQEDRERAEHEQGGLLRAAEEAYSHYIAGLRNFCAEEQIQILQEQLEDLPKFFTQKPAKKAPDSRRMNYDVFWELIEESEGDTSMAQIEVLTEALTRFGLGDIKKFQKILYEKMCELYHWDIWAVAYAKNKGCSDDSFEYFRAGIILQGKECFELAGEDPLSLAKRLAELPDVDCEDLLYVAADAYEQKKDEPLPYTEGRVCKLKGTEWQEDKLQQLYPEICSVLNYS